MSSQSLTPQALLEEVEALKPRIDALLKLCDNLLERTKQMEASV